MIFLLTLGCASQPPPSAPLHWQSLKYKLGIHAQFESSDCIDCIDGLPAKEELDLTWTIEIMSDRQHRDSSVDMLFRITEVEGKRGDGSLFPLSYEERPALLSGYQSGKLLKIKKAFHLSGPNRHMDVFDLTFPLLFPSPPALSEKGSHWESRRWPAKWTPSVKGVNKLLLDWKHLMNDGSRVHIGYEGDWLTDATWNHLTVVGKGRSSGQFWISDRGGLPLEHRFDWSREMCYQGKQRLCQKQRFVGLLERL